MSKKITPTICIATFSILALAVINGLQLMTQIPINFVDKFKTPGADYADFYEASNHIINGENPYLTKRYVTPPLFSLVNVPLAMFGANGARILFLSLAPLTILLSYFLIYSALKKPGTIQDAWQLAGGVVVILFSYPVYFLFERGNIDGVVLLCMCLALYLESRKQWQSGMVLSMAILFKIYPILLMAWLFVTRRWKVFLWVCAWIVIFSLLTGSYWGSYVERLSDRAKGFKFEENGSLINTVLFLYGLVNKNILEEIIARTQIDQPVWRFAQAFSLLIYVVMLGTLIIADFILHRSPTHRNKIVYSLLYIPFMVALPRTVYHYEYVVLIALLPCLDYLWNETSSKPKLYLLVVISLGIALSQWQAVALYTLTNNVVTNYVPGIGLLLVMLGISLYKLLELKDAYSFKTTNQGIEI